MKKFLILLVLFFKSTFFLGQITYNWATYTNGATTYTNGNMSVSITGTEFANSSPKLNTPCNADSYLNIQHDWTAATRSTVIVITFSTAVCGPVTFGIKDVNSEYMNTATPYDAYWVDQVLISATSSSNTAILPVVSNTCTNSMAYKQKLTVNTNTITIDADINASSGISGCGTCYVNNVSVGTAAQKIKSIMIVYRNHPSANAIYQNNPRNQFIGISTITASALPPTVSIAAPACNTNSTSVNLIGSASGTISPTYAWSSSTGTINSGSGSLTANVKSPGNFTLTATNTSGCSNTATVALTALLCNLLPIELTKFTSYRLDNTVRIEWQTSMEKNNDYFILERSLDGINFQEIEKIKGSVNISKSTNYFAIDETPSSEVSYYRLTQIDFNRQYKHSNVVSVDADNSKITLNHISPNPTSSNINFIFFTPIKGELSFEITDLTGRVMISKNEMIDIGNSKQIVLMEEFPNGIYFLKVTFDKANFVSINKVFKN